MICLTICSNNYFAMAKTLADSWVLHHPGSRLVIGLVDKRAPDIDYQLPAGVELWEVESLGIPEFAQLVSQYTITELCTALKPHFLERLLSEGETDGVVYLDPDILIFKRLTEVEEALKEFNFVLTPQICSPIDVDAGPNDAGPNDYHMLRSGVFNLGFFAIAPGPTSTRFLQWWKARMACYAYRDDQRGLFYDQIWMNYIPAFYDSYRVIRDLGYNVANWNLHERVLSKQGESYFVNDTIPLTFFHFSNYNLERAEILAGYNRRVSFATRPDVIPLFETYRQRVYANGHQAVSGRAAHFQRTTRAEPKAGEEDITLRFDEHIAPMIRARLRSMVKKASELPHGGFELVIPVSLLEDIERLVLNWKEHVTMKTPNSHVDATSRRIRVALANDQ
ncbi:MAG TPA: hypothetical protein VL069_02560 [Opitutus sp.]|nr:hypothetical protein [Opitutus sp.]